MSREAPPTAAGKIFSAIYRASSLRRSRVANRNELKLLLQSLSNAPGTGLHANGDPRDMVITINVKADFRRNAFVIFSVSYATSPRINL